MSVTNDFVSFYQRLVMRLNCLGVRLRMPRPDYGLQTPQTDNLCCHSLQHLQLQQQSAFVFEYLGVSG